MILTPLTKRDEHFWKPHLHMKRIAITVENRRLLVVRRGQRQVMRGWSEPCHADRHMLTIEYAALVSGLSHRQLFRQIENGLLHFSEALDSPRLCLDSLCEFLPQVKELVSTFPE